MSQRQIKYLRLILLRWNQSVTVCLIFLLSMISGCKKFIEVPLPGTEIFPKDVFDSDLTATAAVTGIYGNMINSNGLASGNTQSVTFLCGLSADELQNYSAATIQREFAENNISVNNLVVEEALWDRAYQYIYAANAVLEGLERSIGITSATRAQLQGEALFIRAFCHFYLANLFGDIPYLDSTDYTINIIKPRTPLTTVYQRVVADLQAAQGKLGAEYVKVERVRPNKWVATALLARVYLYMENWDAAESQATSVIDQSNGAYALDSLNGVFLKNSKETIWQLIPNNVDGVNTWEGNNFILNTTPASSGSNTAVLSKHLLDAFENDDQRRVNWVDSVIAGPGNDVYYYPYKYKIQSGVELKEYSMVIRLAELYLIRAEARAQLGNIDDAQADLNTIRKRAGLLSTAANNIPSLLTAIAHERQVELFAEWGHRWMDLNRTGKANTILGPIKGGGWRATDKLYPIPQNERSLNPYLTQNPGYN